MSRLENVTLNIHMRLRKEIEVDDIMTVCLSKSVGTVSKLQSIPFTKLANRLGML